MDLQEVGGSCGDWMEYEGYDEEPSGSENAGNFLTICRTS